MKSGQMTYADDELHMVDGIHYGVHSKVSAQAIYVAFYGVAGFTQGSFFWLLVLYSHPQSQNV